MKKIFWIVIIIGAIVFCYSELKPKNSTEIASTENNIVNKEKIEEVVPEPKIYNNVLVVGNSITIERDGIGMAASDQYHDYYYLVKSKLEEQSANLKMNRISSKDWEENTKISSRTEWINQNLTDDLIQDLDLVIFQLGDNFVPTEELENSMKEMVDHIQRKSPNARMLWLSMWFINEERLAIIPKICEKLNIEFIDISDLVVDENKSEIGQQVIGIDGQIDRINTIEEAFHPNDKCMAIIADRIIKKLDL